MPTPVLVTVQSSGPTGCTGWAGLAPPGASLGSRLKGQRLSRFTRARPGGYPGSPSAYHQVRRVGRSWLLYDANRPHPLSGRRVYESAGVSPPPRARGDVAVDAVLAALGLHAGGLRRRRAGLGVAAEHLGDGCLRPERATRRALPTGRATTGPVAAECMGPEGRAATGRCSLPLASRIGQRHRQSPGAERSGSARVGCCAGCPSGTVAGCRSIRRFPGCSTRLQSPDPDV